MSGTLIRLRTLGWQIANSRAAIAVLLRDRRGVFRAVGGATPFELVWAVRRDWPDGTHELIRPCRTSTAARRQLVGDARFWCRGPMRPRLSVVELTLAECRAHLRGTGLCRSAVCPTGSPVRVPVVWG